MTRPRVVVVGGGFAGLAASRALARAPVEVVVVDRHNHHVCQPLLYQVATAGLSPADIDYINAHGTSTQLNDKTETKAIKLALGEERARKIAISSTKSMTGHLLGAAGAVESVACALAMTHKTIPPTINLENPDPDCDLDYVPNTAREATINACLNNSLGFGGHNATLCFKRI